MYPVYPLLAFMAAFSLSTIIDIICGIVSEMCGDDKEHLKAVQLMKKENDKVRTSNTVHVGDSRIDEEISSHSSKLSDSSRGGKLHSCGHLSIISLPAMFSFLF